jgi:hypothetical protein
VCDFSPFSLKRFTYSSRITRPREAHEALLNPSSGRKFASVTEIRGVGHLVSGGASSTIYYLLGLQIPQRIPDELGRLFYKILASFVNRSANL